MNKVAKDFRSDSKGVSLIEVLIALAILGIIATAFLGGLSTAFKADIMADERTNAESLTRSELEYIRNSTYWPFGFSYEVPATPDNPPPWDLSHTSLDIHYASYSVNVAGVPIDPYTRNPLPAGEDEGLQQITAQVYHQGKLVLTTSTYKVSR